MESRCNYLKKHSYAATCAAYSICPNCLRTRLIMNFTVADCWVPGVRVAHRTDPEFHELPRYDGWHFAEDAAPLLLDFVHGLLGSSDAPRASLPPSPAQEPRASLPPSPALDLRAAAHVPMKLEDQASVEDDDWRVAIVTEALTQSNRIALFCDKSGFPELQDNLPTVQLHDLLFFDLLHATKGSNSKSKNKLSGWRRYFGQTEQGKLQWLRIKEAVQATMKPRMSWADESESCAEESTSEDPAWSEAPARSPRWVTWDVYEPPRKMRRCSACGSSNTTFPAIGISLVQNYFDSE